MQCIPRFTATAAWPLLLLAAPLAAATSTDHPRPNVLVIVLDDVGLDQLALYDDLNHYPARDSYEYARTPNLDALAQSGVRFTQARANPICSPTRALISSGRYGFRNGVGTIVRAEGISHDFTEFSVAPAPDELNLPEAPELSAYQLAWIGKWHLGLTLAEGGSGDLHPQRIGWPHFTGAFRNLNQHPNPGPIVLEGHSVAPGYNHWYRIVDGQRTVETTYATVQQRIDCQDWILAQDEDPWCAVLALSACHSPYDWPPDGTHSLDAKWPLGSGVLWEHYRAMLESVDHQLGELLFSLGDALDNTLVIVLGDNGTPTSVLESAREEGQDLGLYESVVDNHRFKGSCYEPGTRVPFLASGPMIVHPGRSSAELVDVVDLHATIRELAAGSGTQAPSASAFNQDSHSFAGLLRDPHAESLRDFSFTELFTPNGDFPSPAQADRGFVAPVLGDGSLYKLVRRSGHRDEVYDLTHDPLERVDLGRAHPAYPKLAGRLEILVGH